MDRLETNDATPELGGTVDDPLATVEVTVGGQTHAGTNLRNGRWILPDNTITPPLVDGVYDVQVAAQNALGIGGDITTDELTIDTINDPPVLTPIGPKNGDEQAPLTFTVAATDQDQIGRAHV